MNYNNLTNHKNFNELLVSTKLVLPPLCGYTDYPYRQILVKFGAQILCTEMIKAKAVLLKNECTLKMLSRSREEPFTGAQLVGTDPGVMAEAAVMCQDMGFAFVDINLGCPVRKIVSKNEGSALLRNSLQVKKILQAVRCAITIPLSIKMRLGFKTGELKALEIARMAEDMGVNAITIHARSVEQKYSGPPDWSKLGEVVKAVQIPVIANGGVTSGTKARQVLAETGAVAVMPGRAILGNPWLIGEILFHLHGKPIEDQRSILRIKEIVLEHFDNLVQFYDETLACLIMRKFLSFYFKGVPGVLTVRKNLTNLTSRSVLLSLLEQV